nr:hypothetical protein CFP56_05321 [Quercus suber]
MLRLDDGIETWVQCKYERVHKLCTKCGLIGHTRSQCSESMDEVERMLIRQRQRIQRLHQSAPAPNPNQSNSTAPTPYPSSHHHDFGHASLHTTIRSLSINRGNVPPTPVNSPTSPSDTSHNQNLNLNLHADPLLEPNPSLNSNTSLHATQENQNNNSLHEMWVNGIGPFFTNGELREATGSSSTTESDSEMVVLFNLDRLNDNHPEWLCGNAWERGQIPESPDRLNNPMVNREERDRLQAVVGNVQSGPSSISASGSAQYQNPTQNMHELHTLPNLNHSVSLDTGLDVIRNSEVSDTASNLSSSSSARTDPGICGHSKKRFGIELGRIRRNIRQKLLCGSFSKEGIRPPSQVIEPQEEEIEAVPTLAIRSLSINRGNVPPTPVNSPTSPSNTSHNQNLNLNLHADPLLEPNPSLNSNTSLHATQENQNNNSLHEMWVNGIGPFFTNGELREATGSSSATESDSEMVVLFNLDRLNDNHPEWLRGNAWERGQIPESPDRLNNPMVNREERDRLQAVVGNVQSGPSSISASGSAQYQNPTQNMHELHTLPNLNHSVSLDTGLDVIRNSEVSGHCFQSFFFFFG